LPTGEANNWFSARRSNPGFPVDGNEEIAQTFFSIV
jgi:hypothetical protein